MRIGFVGAGAMGVGMIGNLLKAGHAVTVWNRSKGPLEGLNEAGAHIANTPADCAAQDIVISMLADDAAVAEVTLDPAFISAMPSHGLHLGMATISVAMGDRLTEAFASAGRGYVSAPVFGRPPAAAAAQLFIIAAGEPAAIARCQPLFDVLGQRSFVVGERPSLANVVKLSGNFMLASMIETLGEAFALTRKHGINPQQYLDILTSTLFTAPVYKVYGGLIAGEQYEPAGFKLALGLKDVRLAQAAADAAMVPMPFAGVLHDRYMTAVAQGHGHLDWAGIARLAAEAAGLNPLADQDPG